MLAGCPLPFEYNGKGAGNAPASDPSSPNMTAPVAVSYSAQGGGSGTIADGGSAVTGQTTTVTLSTTSLNAVIFYTTDGSTLTNLRTAQKIDASSGPFTITRTTTTQSLDIHAVAVGPNMLPSPSVHATVSVSPYPILTVTRNNATISEDGGTATFTITASIGPGQRHDCQPCHRRHIRARGGDRASVPWDDLHCNHGVDHNGHVTLTANHDVNGVNETVSVAINPDPANPATYTVGSPPNASLTIQDDATPELSLSADRAFMTDGQSATFTVSASFAAPSNLTVNIVSIGYAPGTVTVPAAVVLPAGATSVTFPVSAPSIVGYIEQAPLVSVAAGTGYTVGSPSSQSLIVTDIGYPFNGLWNFSTGNLGSSVAGASAWTLNGNVPLVNGSLSFSGNYPNDYASADVSSILNQNQFTLGIGFRMADLSAVHDIVVGGFGARWMMLDTDTSGNISLVLNNHTINIPLGFAITAGTDHALLVSIDTATLTVVAYLDGVGPPRAFPEACLEQQHPPFYDQVLASDDFSTANVSVGCGTGYTSRTECCRRGSRPGLRREARGPHSTPA